MSFYEIETRISREQMLADNTRQRERHTTQRRRHKRAVRSRIVLCASLAAVIAATCFIRVLLADDIKTAYAATDAEPDAFEADGANTQATVMAPATSETQTKSDADNETPKIATTLAYVSDDIEDAVGTLMDVPAASTGAKTYMDYRTITCTTSAQWALQQSATTDELGFRRYGDYYMVALGTYYADDGCGRVFRITFESGETIEAIVGDVKADTDTDALNQHRNGNVVEFIVDSTAIPQMARLMGDMSYADEAFEGNIVSIELIDEK